MGSSASKLRKYLQRGDEYAALRLCERHPELKRSLDPNGSYGEQHGHNTALHYAARHSMRALVRIFLHDMSGDPNKRNGDDATAAHLICQGGARMSRFLDDKIRAECLAVVIAWRGAVLQQLANEAGAGANAAEGGEDGNKEERVEKANLDAVDAKRNTALHYAAGSGLRRCVELLVSADANLTLENEAKETACDVAERCGHADIATYLETKMVFADDSLHDMSGELVGPVVEGFSGLREKDLMEAKDLLLVETSDMLRIPLFTAEALLRNHEWSREALWASWQRDATGCCERAGVQAPASAVGGRSNQRAAAAAAESDTSSVMTERSPKIDNDPESTGTGGGLAPIEDGDVDTAASSPVLSQRVVVHAVVEAGQDGDPLFSASVSGDVYPECEICVGRQAEIIANSECGHRFCTPCWKLYITMRIESGEPHNIGCPAHACSRLVPLELIEKVVSPPIARKYLAFDIKAFVDSNPRIKWCPYPGCGCAVHLPLGGVNDDEPPVYIRAFPKLQPPPPTSTTVLCPQQHSFCWHCLADGHEPTSCDRWADWHDKIAQVRPEELRDTARGSESAASCLWLVTHSKPCPKCKSPIQKNEGCNHMKCCKCKHDFCWVCLGQWKKHGTETGGYFRCNRYEETRKVEQKTDAAISQAKQQSRKAQELNRFVHYYSRFKNHLNSFDMEKALEHKVSAKVEYLAKLAVEEGVAETDLDESPTDFGFIQSAIAELLRSRKVLSSSYAYGYYLKDCGYNKTIFEYLQNELEVSVESLSGLVGRSYLRGSRTRIVHTTGLVASRRERFVVCIRRGLVPPETPPNLRKARKHRRQLPAILGLDKADEQWLKAGLALALTDLDPMTQPWVRDGKGRHHNLCALLDWPQDAWSSDDDDEDPYENDDELVITGGGDSRAASGGDSSATGDNAAQKNSDSANASGSEQEQKEARRPCGRDGCRRVCAKNPRTGAMHDFCSLKCQYLHASAKAGASDQSGASSGSFSCSGGAPITPQPLSARRQYNVDLMIALQMSRLQLLRDLKLLNRSAGGRDADSSDGDSLDGDRGDDLPGTSDWPHSSGAGRSGRTHPFRVSGAGFLDNLDLDPDFQLAIERSMMDFKQPLEMDDEGTCGENAEDVKQFLLSVTEKKSARDADGPEAVCDKNMLASLADQPADKTGGKVLLRTFSGKRRLQARDSAPSVPMVHCDAAEQTHAKVSNAAADVLVVEVRQGAQPPHAADESSSTK